MTAPQFSIDNSVTPPEMVAHDAQSPCPYLPGRQANLPPRIPLAKLSPSDFDDRLARGYRRSGPWLYRPQCVQCQACEPIRVCIETFSWRRSFIRTRKKGDANLQYALGPPITDNRRIALYNKHRTERNLGTSQEIDAVGYRHFLEETLTETFELRLFHKNELAAVAITDRGERALSLVYCYYEPALRHLSLGTYSILKHIELASKWKLDYVYLGYYVRDNAHMSYKERFRPHERLINNNWRPYDTRGCESSQR